MYIAPIDFNHRPKPHAKPSHHKKLGIKFVKDLPFYC